MLPGNSARFSYHSTGHSRIAVSVPKLGDQAVQDIDRVVSNPSSFIFVTADLACTAAKRAQLDVRDIS